MKDKICDCLFEEPCGLSQPLVIVICNLLSVVWNLKFVIFYLKSFFLITFLVCHKGHCVHGLNKGRTPWDCTTYCFLKSQYIKICYIGSFRQNILAIHSAVVNTHFWPLTFDRGQHSQFSRYHYIISLF